MSRAPALRWIERSAALYEARVTTAGGRAVYAGYVAVSPGQGSWRGYVGVGFTPVGRGPQLAVQRLVEQHVLAVLEQAGEMVSSEQPQLR